MIAVRHSLRRTVFGSVIAAMVVAMTIVDGSADPAADAMAKLQELSTQALETREAVTAAQREADDKLAAQTAAEERHRVDLTALEAANAELAPHQAAVDRFAAMTYMGGGTSQFSAALTATSPQDLIDRLSLNRVVAAQSADRLKAFQAARERAAAAAGVSEASATEARVAAEQAVAVRAELQGKYRDLQRQISAAEAQYAMLTPQQQAVIDVAAAVPPPVAAIPPGDVMPPPDAALAMPEMLPVGVANEAGLQLNTVYLARAVSARYPQISEIGGVRPDSKPWHPSGLAIDVMIPNASSPEGIALGEEILAFVMSNSARFGLQDAIWRGTYYTPGGGAQSGGYGHYDHVHFTTMPRR